MKRSPKRKLHGVTPPLALYENNDLDNEGITPEQFFTLAQRSAAHWTGTRRLLFAVLQEALHCWFRYRHARCERGRRLFREAHTWFWSTDQDWLFAFERICAHLDIDPAYIRYRLNCYQTTQVRRRSPSLPAEPVPVPEDSPLVHDRLLDLELSLHTRRRRNDMPGRNGNGQTLYTS